MHIITASCISVVLLKLSPAVLFVFRVLHWTCSVQSMALIITGIDCTEQSDCYHDGNSHALQRGYVEREGEGGSQI